MMLPRHFFFFFAVQVLSTHVMGELVLRQLHVVAREGVTNRTAHDGTLLSKVGEQQMFSLGVWIQSKYESLISLLRKYDPQYTRFESCDLHHSIVSASILSQGMFGKNAHPAISGLTTELPVPPMVHVTPHHNDIWTRAVENCPSIEGHVQELYQSKRFLDYEKDHEGLLEKLPGVTPVLAERFGYYNVPLQDTPDAYDVANVAKVECGVHPNPPVCSLIEDGHKYGQITNDEWTELKAISIWVELEKYATQANLVGGNLLSEILHRMSLDEPGSPERIYVSVTDSATLIGILSALDATLEQRNARVPGYSSALVLELWENKDDRSRWVRMVIKEYGDNKASLMKLPCEVMSGANRGYCTFSNFTQTAKQSIPSTQEWCVQCINRKADKCLIHHELLPPPVAKECPPPISNPKTANFHFGAFISGICLVALLYGGNFLVKAMIRRKRQIEVQVEDQQPGSNMTNVSDSPSRRRMPSLGFRASSIKAEESLDLSTSGRSMSISERSLSASLRSPKHTSAPPKDAFSHTSLVGELPEPPKIVPGTLAPLEDTIGRISLTKDEKEIV